jgi:hypothetical protein
MKQGYAVLVWELLEIKVSSLGFGLWFWKNK